MIIKRLLLKDFRNYAQAEVFFEKGVNVFIGKNGQGKTNLLEAIHFALTGRSFRTEKTHQLIQHQKTRLFTSIEYEQETISQLIKIDYSLESKKILSNATSLPSLSSLTGIVPTISISPSDIEILMGPPSERRRFINLFIAQQDPIYLYHLARYQKALKMRNILLKKQSKESIRHYESILAHSACYLSVKRKQALDQLSPFVSKEYQKLSRHSPKIDITYSLKEAPSIDLFLHHYGKNRQQEEKLGITLFGPHRDDLLFILDDQEVKSFASEGQKRTLLIALKLAELICLQEITTAQPILFIDDFAIHLDHDRCDRLGSIIQNYAQVFLTTPQNLFENATTYSITNGKLDPNSLVTPKV